MRFQQIEKITEIVPGERLKAVRTLRGEEDYLRDHFPLFPVMPGVLMLEALFQASTWLVRVTDKFETSIITLAEAKNVKFADFVEPGQTLEINVELIKNDAESASLKGTGIKDGVTAVSARLVLAKSKLSNGNDGLHHIDRFMAKNPKKLYDKLLSVHALPHDTPF
jgi:3-hydroxyacyl-[acyl-carrier-protein] dehydratase